MRKRKEKRRELLKLEYLRKKYGYKQSDLASFIGVSTSTYSSKVHGKTPITLDEQVIIMLAINKKAEKVGDGWIGLDTIFLD